MRQRAVFGVLTMALAFGAAAAGCQIIAQLTVLEVGTGGAGTGGSTSSRNSSSSGGADCMMAPGCPDGSICLPGPPGMPSMTTCEACGAAPAGGVCPMGCDSCTQQTCFKSCGDAACSMTLLAQTSGVKLHCASGQCTSIITCQGAYPCEVDCDMGACTGLTMVCDVGPCVLDCAGMGCMNATLTCGDNRCTIEAPPPPDAMPAPYHFENCSKSCDCSVQTM
jgi:hypothetical protein